MIKELQGNLLQKIRWNKKFLLNFLRFEELPEDQKLSKLCSEAGLNLVEIGQYFHDLPSPKEPKNQSLCREYTLPRDEERTCVKWWIQSNAKFGPVSDIKVCKSIGRYGIEVEVSLLFEDHTISWIRIANGVEKYVREAMPVHEEERALGRPAAKAKPILKPSSTSEWNFIPVGQRRWIDSEVQHSKDPFCFQMSKFITNLLRHKNVGREGDAGVELLKNARKSYQKIRNIGRKKQERGSSRRRAGQRTSG